MNGPRQTANPPRMQSKRIVESRREDRDQRQNQNRPSKTERAARQQGGPSLRENSSNGGKAIRTFWLHSRGGETECQGEFRKEISYYFSIIYTLIPERTTARIFGICLPGELPETSSFQVLSWVFCLFPTGSDRADAIPGLPLGCGQAATVVLRLVWRDFRSQRRTRQG